MGLVVITGGNRGIGKVLAQLFAAEGREVVLGVRNVSAVAGLPGEILPLDVRDDGSVTQFARLLAGRPVDVLVNNAGVIGPMRQSALDTDFVGFLDTLNVNTIGPLRVTQALLANLRKSGSPKVAVLTSRMGSLSYAKSDRIAYRASKAAANKVVQCLATDLAPAGIAVAAIHPGWVRTDMGGPSADIEPDESARGVRKVIDMLSLDNSGQFWSYDGSNLEW